MSRPPPGQADPIGVVEAAYDLEADEEAWLRALVVAAALDEGCGTTAHIHDDGLWLDPDAARQQQRLHFWDVPPGFLEGSYANMRSLPAPWVRWLHACAPPVTTVAEMTGGEDNRIARRLRPSGILDTRAVFGRDGLGRCAVLQAASGSVVRLSDSERRLWERLSVHIGAGLRLRGLVDLRATLEDGTVEALLDTGGRCVDARGPARAASARAVLREAARRIDRARTQGGRAEPEEALDLWQGLTAGRWSLVDHFDSDGRRFVVARRNDPNLPDPRALTLRQRQVAALAATGQTNKLIAYALGIHEAAVSAFLRQALRKLGLGSVAELRAATYPMPLAPESPDSAESA
jgi:DNA-binding CsgD family transcriptional regulator